MGQGPFSFVLSPSLPLSPSLCLPPTPFPLPPPLNKSGDRGARQRWGFFFFFFFSTAGTLVGRGGLRGMPKGLCSGEVQPTRSSLKSSNQEKALLGLATINATTLLHGYYAAYVGKMRQATVIRADFYPDNQQRYSVPTPSSVYTYIYVISSSLLSS